MQALREVGSEEKTQYWDREDIMRALRAANLRGVRVDNLYARPSLTTSRVTHLRKASLLPSRN
jgi:hypothetical protein